MDETVDALAASFGAVETSGVPDARPLLAGGRAGGAAFESFVRSGADYGVKAMSGATDAAGGYAVPREIDAQIDATLASISPIRAIANVVTVGSAGYRKLVASGGTPSGWASETGARAETATPAFNEIAPPMGELYANPAASQAMLDDAAFDVEGWLADEIAREFARAEGAAFVSGNGSDKPRGFLAATTSTAGDATRAFGTVQHLLTGAAGAFAANPEEKLIDLVQALRPPYRQGATWVMNSATLARIRKVKASDGSFLWAPGIMAGQPATLLGYPVVEAEDMPDIAAGSLSIAFGNFKAGYLIAERGETAILRDPYSNKPFVHFYATTVLDIIAQASVESFEIDTPPGLPAAGTCWVVGAAPTGAWSGEAGAIAMWTDGGWRFVAPRAGTAVWIVDEGLPARFVAGAWRRGLLAEPSADIAAPAGGATVDTEARAAIAAILAALRQHRLIVSL